jgi:hypothetical protein
VSILKSEVFKIQGGHKWELKGVNFNLPHALVWRELESLSEKTVGKQERKREG